MFIYLESERARAREREYIVLIKYAYQAGYILIRIGAASARLRGFFFFSYSTFF